MRKMVKEVPQQEVFTPRDTDEYKIYIVTYVSLSGVSKLSKIVSSVGTKSYKWVSLENTKAWHNAAEYPSIEEALKNVGDNIVVYEFDNLKEFAQWLLER